MKRLAYLMGTFPSLTETFILGEIEALHALGVELHLFALRRPQGAIDKTVVHSLAAKTDYSRSVFASSLWLANLRALRRRPGRYLRVLVGLVARTVVNPVHCLKSLGIFPVAVCFAEVCRHKGIEHIHAHWANYPATAAYVIARLLDIPFSFTAHAYDATLIRALLKEKVRRAVSIVTCTRMNQRFLSAMVPEAAAKIRVNYHGIALDHFTPNGTQQSPRQGPLHILSCGSLYPRKGFPDLLEACRLLRDQGYTFQCTIIGQGPQRRRLERFIRKHRLSAYVHLAGALPQQQVIQAYRTADVFVLPCVTDYLGWDELFTEPIRLLEVGLAIPFRPITDGIPNVLAEAMAMGIPVVATTIAGIPELIEDGCHGLLVPERTPRALAHAMARLMHDPEKRRELAERASERVRQVFDRSQNIQELVEMLTTLTPPARYKEEGMAQGRRQRPQTISPGAAPQAPAKLPMVSVVLPVRNAERDIQACLEAVLGQNYPPHLLELIVVDGNSQDGTRCRIADYAQRDARIKLLSNPAGTIPAGLNIGIQAASGEIVARVDVRTSLAADYLKTAVELLASTGADNVGGPVRGVSPTVRGRALILARESRFGLAGAAARYGETTEHWTDTVYLGVYPRRVFATIGLYDEEVIQDEDAELNYRLRAQGGRILISPRLRTTYFYPSSLRRFLWKNLLFGVSKVRVWQKNPRMLSWRHFIPPVFVAFLVLGPLLGRIHWLFEALWGLSAGAYLMLCLGVAGWYFLRGRGREALLLPLVFPLLHLGWGAGFLVGLVRYAGRWFQHRQAPASLTSKSVLPLR